ncbi:MAG: hypothetical protein ACD_39C00821G0002 [uncultured bacterium]|nr:MAG: hypothetical protein ACD_39C00821G0002 [uncultured bacterium]
MGCLSNCSLKLELAHNLGRNWRNLIVRENAEAELRLHVAESQIIAEFSRSYSNALDKQVIITGFKRHVSRIGR